MSANPAGGATRGCVAILTAAGSGTRLGAEQPKALVELRGESLVVHAARRLADSGCVERIIVTHPEGEAERFAAILDSSRVPIELVPGGATRQSSVAAALARIDDDVDVVLVHDAARALAPPELVRRVYEAVRQGRRAVVPGLPVSDTIKRVAVDGAGEGPVVATVDRATLRAIQTPQGFDRALLARAHEAGAARAAQEGDAATDDAGLVEALGEEVWVVTGKEEARKITVPADLLLAEALLSRP